MYLEVIKKYSKFEEKSFETTVGKLFFNSIFPDDFPYINEEINIKRMSLLVDELIVHYGIDETPKFLDKIKDFGYQYATYSGVTWGIDNVTVPKGKAEIVKKFRKEEELVRDQFNEGLLSEEEQYQKVIEIWEHAKKEIEKDYSRNFRFKKFYL